MKLPALLVMPYYTNRIKLYKIYKYKIKKALLTYPKEVARTLKVPK